MHLELREAFIVCFPLNLFSSRNTVIFHQYSDDFKYKQSVVLTLIGTNV